MAFFSDLKKTSKAQKAERGKKSNKRDKFSSKSNFEKFSSKDSLFKNRSKNKNDKFSRGNRKNNFATKSNTSKNNEYNTPQKNKLNYLDYEYENIKQNLNAQEQDENLLVGRNPIREALKSGRDIEKIFVAKGEINGSAREIVAKARDKKIVVQEVDKRRLDNMAKNHQGMVALASAYKYCDVQDILDYAQEKGEKPFIILLDGITDPHNLGAIIRSAECAGAHGVIIPSRRNVGLTSVAVKASAGAVEHIKVAKVTNIAYTIDELQKQGIWVYAADMNGESFYETDYTGAVALLIGGEGQGVSKNLLEKSDKIVSIPLKGNIESLNASVASAIIMFEISKNR